MKHLKKPKMILVPYPAQGHVSPMQKLAWAFSNLGFEPVIVLPIYLHRKIMLDHNYNNDDDDDEIKWIGLEDGTKEGDEAPDFFGIESAMENNMPIHLENLLYKFFFFLVKLLYKFKCDEEDVVCLVVDLLASWTLQVGHRLGLPTAGFWPVMFASYLLITGIPHMLRTGIISDSGLPQHEGTIIVVPELPILSTEDLPWLIGTVAARKSRFKFWTRTLERSRNLKWLLVDSFPNELTNNKCSQGVCPIALPIAPICGDQITKSLSFWEEDLSCLKWLATQKTNSVVYISFGSWVNPIGESKLKSLALALEASRRPFIWVLRSTWREGLPVELLDRVSKQAGIGKIVSWAPQMEILQHKSVGCFITHCGWNSTLEALQSQKKMLCYPITGDQFVNCAYIVQVWRVGLKLNGLGQKDVEEGLVVVMEDKEMDTRLMRLYERIMGMQGDSKRRALMVKAFLQDIEKKASTLMKMLLKSSLFFMFVSY